MGLLYLYFYHLHVPIVLKCGSLNLLETSGPVQACNGIALPFHYYIFCFLMRMAEPLDGCSETRAR